MNYTLSSATKGTILNPTGMPNHGDLISVVYEGIKYDFAVKVILPVNIEATLPNGSVMILGEVSSRYTWELAGINWKS